SCFPPLSLQTQPAVVIASTVRGKGVPSIEEKADRWFCNFTKDEIESLLLELDTSSPQSTLVTEPLTVR
ncbi:MAG: hypothetical protein JNL32_00755, partial [Candidatus Kapabacteria bacterium]|nr:hypothetical protein [Candidatus Kapabacteria bacterium]